MKQNIFIPLLCIIVLCITPACTIKPAERSGSLEDIGALMVSKALRLNPQEQGGGAKCVGCVLGAYDSRLELNEIDSRLLIKQN